MTVAQLIAALQQLPDQETPVFVSGYEGGYHDVDSIVRKPVLLNCNTAWYYGPHEASSDWERERFPNAVESVAYIVGA